MSAIAFRVIFETPDVLILQDPPYIVPAIVAVFSGVLSGVMTLLLHWRFAFTRTRLWALLLGGLVCLLLGIWLCGLQYEFAFARLQSRIDMQMSWFGRQISFERIVYATPPVASIVTTKNTTHQLVLRFSDGRIEKIGLSTDREGHEDVVRQINNFLGNGSHSE